MKRIDNLYTKIVDIKEIQNMYDKRIKINTKNKLKLEKFENNYVSNIIYIKNILKDKNYIPGRYNIFLVKEPKLRLVMSQNIIDKVINHMVSEYFLVDVFENSFIEENIATRKNKGTHYGIKLLKSYLNKTIQKNKNFYILKFDISKYFFNLDHDIIKRIIRTKIKDKDVLNILDNIIDSTNQNYVNETISKVKKKEIENVINNCNKDKLIEEIKNLPNYKNGKGLPISNMSSQVIAILYLNELDHYIKEKLKIKYYIRYMDDGILIHESKEYLEYCLKEIEIILDKYKLELNNKTKIINIKEGFEFLGFKYCIKNNKVIMKVKNQTKNRFKRKMKNLYKLFNNKKIEYKELLQIKDSYLGHLNYGNTKKMIDKTLSIYKTKNSSVETIKVEIVNSQIIYK